jgi:hypothetical protein
MTPNMIKGCAAFAPFFASSAAKHESKKLVLLITIVGANGRSPTREIPTRKALRIQQRSNDIAAMIR